MVDLSIYDLEPYCFQSYENLRNKIYYNQSKLPMDDITLPKQQQVVKTKKSTYCIENPASDSSIIMLIQNDVRFITLFHCCRKQKSPLAYIFCESGSYLSIVVKAANDFPIMFMRLPIDNIYTYSINTNAVYELPINDILGKDFKYSRNNSYIMMYKLNNGPNGTQTVEFIYELYSGDTEPNRFINNNIQVVGKSVIDNLFRIGSNNISLISNTLTATEISNEIVPASDTLDMFSFYSGVNAIQQASQPVITSDNLVNFYNSRVLVLREIQDLDSVIIFMNRVTSKLYNYFNISPEGIVFNVKTATNLNEKHIASPNDSMLYTGIDKSMDLELLPFDQLYKINYKKTMLPSDNLYYVLSVHNDIYMFMKVITSIKIEINPEKMLYSTFSNIFGSGPQIIECFGCIKHEDVKEDVEDNTFTNIGNVTEFVD